MTIYRAAYITLEDSDFGSWLEAFWNGSVDDPDPLASLLRPRDMRGEVAAWGGPHWTILDALTVSDPDVFDSTVHSICKQHGRPSIEPVQLTVLGSNSLVVMCKSASLVQLRRELIEALRPQISRAPLADEEFQRLEWWIRKVGNQVKENSKALRDAQEHYNACGSPALPLSRYFRCGYFLRLFKETFRTNGDAQRTAEQNLSYFLTHGEPTWYASDEHLHITIASGIEQTLIEATLSGRIWEFVKRKMRSVEPSSLSIMGTDVHNDVDVNFYDWATETFVQESRPGFCVREKLDFQQQP